AARVDVRGHAVPRGDAQDLEDLVTRGGGRVRGAEPDSDGPLAQAAVGAAHALGLLLRRGRLLGARAAGQELARIAEHRHAHGDVADGGAVVDELPGLALAVPRADVADADLELEPGRHAVQHRVAVILRVLAVAVQVDEPGRDDQAGRIDDPRALQRTFRDRDDAVAADADAADRVQPGLRVDHAAVGDDEVVRPGARPAGLGQGGGRADQREGEQERETTPGRSVGVAGTGDPAPTTGLRRGRRNAGPRACSLLRAPGRAVAN